jgi:putative protein-disulfide isomerase
LVFAERLQQAIYSEGVPPSQWAAYGQMAADFGLNAEAFAAVMRQAETVKAAQEDFDWAARLQVRGFPTVFLEHKEQWHALGSGYMTLETLEVHYQAALKMMAQ